MTAALRKMLDALNVHVSVWYNGLQILLERVPPSPEGIL